MAETGNVPWVLLSSSLVLGFCVTLGICKLKNKNQRVVVSRQNVVITGGSKGIGFALAKEFLQRGNNVVICGRSQERLDIAKEKLAKQNSAIGICVADVTSFESISNLLSFSLSFFQQHTGRAAIDIWINNAGVSQSPLSPLADTDENIISSVISTNLIGSLLCTKLAIKQMSKQPNGGHVFLMDGAGSNGMTTANFAAYGVSKAGIPQLLKSLVKETKGTKVGIHAISPGMVITDLLMKSDNADSNQKKPYKIFNILAERPSVVGNWLTNQILLSAKPGSSGTYNRFLTTPGAIWRFLTFWSRKNRLIDESTGEILFNDAE